MRYDIHLKLANDRFKCDSACVSWFGYNLAFILIFAVLELWLIQH